MVLFVNLLGFFFPSTENLVRNVIPLLSKNLPIFSEVYLRPVYTGDQVNSMAKEERRHLARYMARLLATTLKANGHEETNTKGKSTRGW